MPRPRIVGRSRAEVRALVLEQSHHRCAWCDLPAEFVAPRSGIRPELADAWKAPSGLAAWCGRCDQDPTRLAARPLQGPPGMKTVDAKTAFAAPRQARYAVLKSLVAGVSLPGGVKAFIPDPKQGSGLFFLHVQIATQSGEQYTFSRLLADVTQNFSTDGLSDGEHELVLRGVKYESQMDAPPEVRTAADRAYALLAPVLRDQ